ncbi:hypothetical protein ACE1CD_15410 [Aerosakkonema sp. BLCC-F183]|uniref:hypothetical protein n=1 Tax=Aerosakkonema sp. BLCC-F183 TaxID=3342834 RepID=UPI0035B93CA5
MKGFPIELDLTEIFQTNNKEKLLKNLKKIVKHSLYYHKLNQRTFHNPSGFTKWDEFVSQISLQLISVDNIPVQYQDFVTLNSNILLREIIENNAITFPCYWLNKNLLQAFEATDLPNVMGIKRSHKYGVIFLPTGEVQSPEGKNVNWIIFSHILKSEELLVRTPSEQVIINKPCSEDILQIFTITAKDCYFSGCSLERTDENKMPYREKNLLEISVEENEFINKLLSLTLQCLLWLQIYNPKESIPAGAGFNKSPFPNSFSPLNPRWIGKDYQPKIISQQITSSKINCKQLINRKSPTPHERRGHWRSQRVGKGRSQIKTIWIEPHLVGETNVEL